MSIQKYNALLKTIELGSISRAAESMGYTQPAVSKMISDLEAEWGIRLLQRSRNGIEMTAATKYLLPTLKAISLSCAELEYSIGEMRGEQTGLVRVGAFASVADYCLPQIIKRFQADYPNIDIELKVSEKYLEIEDWIVQGKVDCGFVSTPTSYDLKTRFYKQDELYAALPKDHRFAREPYFPVDKLMEENRLILKEKVDFEVLHFLDQLPQTLKPHYLVNGDHTILAMVEAGLGISIMHSLIAESGRYNVVWKPFDVHQYRNICIATQKNIKLPSVTRLFVESVVGGLRSSER